MAVFCLKSCMLAFSIMQTKDLPDVQAGFWKGRETRDQIANIHWITKKARELLKNTYLCFIDHAKVFDCVDSNKLLKALKEMAIPDHLNCLLRNLYAGQEATVRTMCGATEKGVQRGCLLSPCLLNLYAEHLMKKCWAGWVTSWNQDRREKHPQSDVQMIPRWRQKAKRN